MSRGILAEFFHDSRSDAMMEFKGYLGKVEFDDEAGVFHGEVVNTRDVITFQGVTVDELTEAFRDSVNDYLEFCSSRGELPDKPFSGQFVARIPPDLHREVSMAAASAGQSLNAWVAATLESAIHSVRPAKPRTRSKSSRRASKVRQRSA